MTKTARPVRHFTDNTGRDLVAVPLSNSDREAVLSAEDFAHIRAQSVSARWFINGAGGGVYVRCTPHKRNTTSVHKLILHPTKQQHVHRADGDACNMRRENLIVAEGSRCAQACPHHRTASR